MTDGRLTSLDLLHLASIASLALCLIPVGAHLFALPNKMAFDDNAYMAAQKLYAGWAWFGVPIAVGLLTTAAHAAAAWRHWRAVVFSLAAFVCLGASQGVYWSLTQPMNTLTANWSVMPADLNRVRAQWEVSHAINAGLTFMALILQTLAILKARDTPRAAGDARDAR